MKNKDIEKILQTPLTDKDIMLPPSLVDLLKQNGVETFGELINMTYKEINNIKGFGRTNTFKVCLRAQWFSADAFYNSNLAKSIENMDERRYSQYYVGNTAIATYKKYKNKIEVSEQNISL